MGLQEDANEFQGAILRSVSQHRFPYTVKLKGVDYVLFPETFNPNYAKASLLLLDNLGVMKGDEVLDPFTGCGADAIFSVLEGAKRAVAIDKFLMPVLCCKYNAHMLGLDGNVDVRQGDLFDPLKGEEKFDLVLANPPFRRMDPESEIEAAIRDSGYSTLRRFFSEVGRHLKPNGRVRTVFSNVGDLGYFHGLAKDNGFASETVAGEKFASNVIIEVYEMKKR